MFDLHKWQTFSHTHRSFDSEETLDSNLVQRLNTIADGYRDQFHEIVFIQDKTIIEDIYNLSSLPVNDQFKFDNFVNRKNSQLLAPLLIIAIPREYNYHSLALIGELYSRLAHAAIKQGCETGFCICYEKAPAEQLLFQNGYTTEIRQLEIIPFMSLGHHDKTVPHNFQRKDIGQLVDIYNKLSIDSYITVT